MKRINFPRIKAVLTKIPVYGWIGGGVLALSIGYSIIFLIPKPVQFSYASETCIGQWVVAPGLQKTISNDFSVSFEDTLRIGGVDLLSTRLCIEPTRIPQIGEHAIGIAPFGGVIAQKQLALHVPSAPTVTASDVLGRTISTSKPLEIAMSGSDRLYTYSLNIDDSRAKCTQDESRLLCDVSSLKLAHGATYTAALYKSYKTAKTRVFEGTLSTLQPLIATEVSVSEGQTVFDAPTTISIAFDHPIKEVDASLVKVVGEVMQPVSLEPKMSGTSLTLTFPKLEREATYRLTLNEAIAENGSSLAAPLMRTFQTSGGPKVSSVSIGTNSVARNATIIVTLDQPIDSSVEIAKFARLEGLESAVRRKSDTQITFTINGGDCAPFKLILEKGIKSGSNGELSKDTWSHSSRTICGYSWIIGSSVKGRAIPAYSFGSGAKTILFTGGIHGSEGSATTTMQALVQYLQANGDTIPADKRIVIAPNTNPDGIAVGSRNNSRNVNLGRNFPTANWSASIETTSGTLPTGGGTSPGSEPEAAALIQLVRQLKPRLSISYHAQGRLVGANKFSDSVAIGDIYATTVGYRTMYYNAEVVMGYAMTGEMEDWMGEEMNIPAILIELPSASGNYLNAQLPALKKMFAI